MIKIWGLLCFAVVFFLSHSPAEARRNRRCSDELNDTPSRNRSQSAKPGPAKSAKDVRRLEDLKLLNLLTYNLLNLEMHVGKFERGATGLLQLKGPRVKGEPFREEQANLIREENVDIGIFQEIEGPDAFRAFNEAYLKNVFKPLMHEGNDQRGIQVGMLLKQDLPFEIEYRSYADRTWVDPVTGRENRVFSRDIPTLILRAKGNPKPLLVILGTHYKSKRDRNDDPQSNIMRKGQADATVQIIKEMQREFGALVPFVLAGDFNGNYNHEEAYATMRKALDMEDAFNFFNISEDDRVTHTYHPRNGETEYNQIDYFVVSRHIKACIKTAYVHRYKKADGTVKDIPETFEQRKLNPSDHFPVVMQLDFPCLMKVWASKN